jgi:integrase
MKTQGYGSGSLVERSPGVWRMRVYQRESGRQIQKTHRGTETTARRALAKLVADVDAGRFNQSTATVRELLEHWMDHLGPIRKPSTLVGYRRKIDHDINPAIGHIHISKLTARDLDRFYSEKLSDGLSSATVRQLHAILAAALHTAVRWDWLPSNPADKASPPVARSPQMAIPSVEEVSALYQAAREQDPVLGTAVALAALTGARRGELCALRWGDVDLGIGMLTIARSISVIDHVVHFGDTKTHARRDIALDDAGIAVLRERWEMMTRLAREADSPLVEDPFVLSYNANGARPLNPDTLTHKFGKLAKSIGVDAHLHSLRHFSVATLIAAGVDVRTVADRHGHRQATMTLDRYAHVLPARDRAVASILGAAIRPA